MLAMVGEEPQTGTLRWTLDSLYLWDGLPLVPHRRSASSRCRSCAICAIARTAVVTEGAKIDAKTGMLLGVKDCFTHWFLILRCSWIGSFMGAIPGIGGLGHRLDLLCPRAAHREGRAADLRQGRHPRRHRRRKRHQCTRGRRAGADGRVRRADQRRHGDPARRVPDPRAGARPRHARQEPGRDLFDGVEHRHRQHSRLRPVLPVQRPVRQARDAALHADHAGRAEPRLYRGVRGRAAVGRPLLRCCSSASSAGR